MSDVVCPWGRPVWGGLASYFNRGLGGFKAGWSLGVQCLVLLHPQWRVF